MLRTIIVTIAGLILSALLAATATALMLSHTQFGRLATGNADGVSDRWQVFMSGSRILFSWVCLPTVILVSVFVGSLANKSTPTAAAVAVLPISVLASGLTFRGIWISLVLLLCAVLLSSFSRHLIQRTATG